MTNLQKVCINWW